MNGGLSQMARVQASVMLSEIEETHADDALLALSKLRDMLVRRDANLSVCLVDDAIASVEAACRESM